MEAIAPEPFLLRLLLVEGLTALGELLAALGQFRQRNHLGLVGIQQAAFLPRQPLQPHGPAAGLRLCLGFLGSCELRELLELGQQLAGITQKLLKKSEQEDRA